MHLSMHWVTARESRISEKGVGSRFKRCSISPVCISFCSFLWGVGILQKDGGVGGGGDGYRISQLLKCAASAHTRLTYLPSVRSFGVPKSLFCCVFGGGGGGGQDPGSAPGAYTPPGSAPVCRSFNIEYITFPWCSLAGVTCLLVLHGST